MGSVGRRKMRMIWIYETPLGDMVKRCGMWYLVYSIRLSAVAPSPASKHFMYSSSNWFMTPVRESVGLYCWGTLADTLRTYFTTSSRFYFNTK